MNFSRGVEGSLSHLWKFGSGGVGVGGAVSAVKFPPWWGLDIFWNLTRYDNDNDNNNNNIFLILLL